MTRRPIFHFLLPVIACPALACLAGCSLTQISADQAARAARLAMGASRRKRGGHLDDIAATYILQTYLDAHYTPSGSQQVPE